MKNPVKNSVIKKVVWRGKGSQHGRKREIGNLYDKTGVERLGEHDISCEVYVEMSMDDGTRNTHKQTTIVPDTR